MAGSNADRALAFRRTERLVLLELGPPPSGVDAVALYFRGRPRNIPRCAYRDLMVRHEPRSRGEGWSISRLSSRFLFNLKNFGQTTTSSRNSGEPNR